MKKPTFKTVNQQKPYKGISDFAMILSLFNSFDVEEKSVTEISKESNMSPSKISRTFKTLEAEGLFERNPETGKYRLGIFFLELGMVCVSNFYLRKVMRPHIEQIAKEFNITSSWGILNDHKVIVIDRVENLNIDLITHRIGLNVPIHCTSIGKILLAFLPSEQQDEILNRVSLTKFTKATVIDKHLIKANLKSVRKIGFATDRGETHEDLNCIAAPIKDSGGSVVAALNLMDEKTRTSENELFKLADQLKQRALFISRQLGYRSNIL